MLIKKTIFVLLPTITLVIIFELLAHTIPASYSLKHSKIVMKQEQIEILVLGSSHSNFGINPQYFGHEAFNIANASQDLYYDYEVLLKYLPKCKNLKLVIIPISYFSLPFNFALAKEAWRSYYYAVYMNIDRPTNSFFDLKRYSVLALWDGPINVIYNVRKPNVLNINDYGYQSPGKGHSVVNDTDGKTRVEYHHKCMDTKLINCNVAIIDKIAKELIKRNIKFVFVTTPVCNTYYKHVSETNYYLMTDTINTLTKKYSTRYYNYFCDNRFEMLDFLDNDHLNENGATKFSIILKNEVIDKLM